MEPVVKVKLFARVLALSVAVGTALPQLNFAGGITARSGSVRGLFRAPAHSSGHIKHHHSSPKRQKFFVVEDRFEQSVSVTVQQTFAVPPAEPEKTPKNMVYIQPRWVESEHGVLISEPGRWVEVQPGAEY